MQLRINKKILLNSSLEGESSGYFMTPSSSPVGRVQEISTTIPEAHPCECQKSIPRIRMHFALRLKMLKPPIARLPAIQLDFRNRPSEEADCVYEANAK